MKEPKKKIAPIQLLLSIQTVGQSPTTEGTDIGSQRRPATVATEFQETRWSSSLESALINSKGSCTLNLWVILQASDSVLIRVEGEDLHMQAMTHTPAQK